MGADRTCRSGKGASFAAPFPFFPPGNHPYVPGRRRKRCSSSAGARTEFFVICWTLDRESLPGEVLTDMQKRMLLLLAHPDDETFGPGGTIAKYAAEGAEITLVTATRGEMGMLGEPPVADRARLGEVRSGELMRAANLLGIRNVRFLGFVDGELASISREKIVERAVEQVRRVRPHVMIGFGPEGVSRHSDHKVMCSVALDAFDAAADPDRFPRQLDDGLLPWGPCKLYQFEIAQEVFDEWGVPLAGVPRAKLTTTVDTSGYVEKKIGAFYCHRTQAKDYNRILARDGYREFCRRETYVLAKSRLPPRSLPESDLFAGIPPGNPGAP